MKKILCLALALMLAMSAFAAFAEDVEVDEYTLQSSEIYNAVLGEYLTVYEDARAEVDNLSLRYAKMALAEAKLMEAAVMFPTRARGGNYAISRVAPYTVTPCLWGIDADRFHQSLIATEFIKSEDRAEMKAKWAELRGTGTYEQWAKDFLAEKGYTLQDNYGYSYNSDPMTWDVLASSLASDSQAIVNTFDGLYEYDIENVMQPALAEKVEVSEDGLTYTFTIRSGVTWVDSQGREIADVKADDFVAGMQHMMDAQGGLEYLVDGIILNATEYIGGEVTDFEQVGVKALDDATLVYTLTAPCPYFMSMLSYSVFAPMCRDFYLSQGGGFGAEYDPSAETYTYGVDSDHIAYCGPYLVTNATAANTIVFSANPTYWNKDNINVHTITWLYNDGSDVTKAYNDALAGLLAGVGLDTSSLTLARADGNFEKYGYISSTNAYSFMAFFNLNRSSYANLNDENAVVSPMTEEQRAASNAALMNTSFRRAVSFAVDRAAYNAQTVGEDLKLFSLRNAYTPGTFVSTSEEVTVEINGEARTYPAGTFYGAIMQDQIDADGDVMKVWDPNGDDGIGSGDGFDGWYNPENAKAELAKAAEELGIEISAANPVYLDLPYPSNNDNFTNRANALKQSIEASLEGAVIVNLVECVDLNEWYYAGFFTDYGHEANYSVYDVSSWGPDYGDPATYLDTFLPDYAGYMVKCIGIF